MKSCLLRPHSRWQWLERESVCLGSTAPRGWSVSTASSISSRTCRRPLFPVILGMVFQIVARQGASLCFGEVHSPSFLGAFWTDFRGKTRECDPVPHSPGRCSPWRSLLCGIHPVKCGRCEIWEWQVWRYSTTRPMPFFMPRALCTQLSAPLYSTCRWQERKD